MDFLAEIYSVLKSRNLIWLFEKKFVLIKEICNRTKIRPICSTNPRIEIVSAVFSVVIVSYRSNLGLCRGFYRKIWSAGPTLAPLYTSTYIGLRSNLKEEKKKNLDVEVVISSKSKGPKTKNHCFLRKSEYKLTKNKNGYLFIGSRQTDLVTEH